MYQAIMLVLEGKETDGALLDHATGLLHPEGRAVLLGVTASSAALQVAGGEGVVLGADPGLAVVQALQDASAHLARKGWSATRRLRQGLLLEEILTATEEESIDLVLLAERPRTGISGWLQGSLAKSLLCHLPCTLLVVRPPQPPVPRSTFADALNGA